MAQGFYVAQLRDGIRVCFGIMAGSSHNLSGYARSVYYSFYRDYSLSSGYFTRPKNENGEKPMFPIEAAGSVLFGAWLVIMPEFFVNILMYVLGALLVIAGVQQLVSLISARKWSNVPLGFYLMPALILITGVMILAYPFGAAANTFVIFGVASIFYGTCELINWYKFRKRIENTGL